MFEISKKRDGKVVIPPTKYVCKQQDLDKLLPEKLKLEFQSLFYDDDKMLVKNEDAWRMFAHGNNPQDVLSQFGIDLQNPRVRDAVAFDFVKLESDSVSNDNEYRCCELVTYSPLEYERFLLNKNYRVNLTNLEPEWSNISYPTEAGGVNIKRKRTLDKVFQGLVLSDTFLSYFDNLLSMSFDENFKPKTEQIALSSGEYFPYTSSKDVQADVALIPNTHQDFPSTVFRNYYNMRHEEYKERLKSHDILFISTFAEVDPEHGKNHTGWFWVKVQRKFPDGTYGYIVAKIGLSGKIALAENYGMEIKVFGSKYNTILCVCESDFNENRVVPSIVEVWEPEIGDIKMEKSSTSSHYSVFRQRIPDYDLKWVRNYVQFKERLQGMNMFLSQLNRMVKSKRAQLSECFIKGMFALRDLMVEFTKSKGLMELVVQYYNYLTEYDGLYVRKSQLEYMVSRKKEELDDLLAEYNGMEYANLDKKLELGEKIKTLKLELDNNIKKALAFIENRLQEIRDAVDLLNENVVKICDGTKYLTDQQVQEIISQIEVTFNHENEESPYNEVLASLQKKVELASKEIGEYFIGGSRAIEMVNMEDFNGIPFVKDFVPEAEIQEGAGADGRLGVLAKIDTKKLNKLVDETERWRDYIYALGFELSTLEQMLTPCKDATIKVKRLLHNFEEKMKDVESQIWTKDRELREDFSFVGIGGAGIYDIILLHDWYAANAYGYTYSDLGFESQAKFMEFRKKCNKVSFNLRQNQYANMLEIDKTRLQSLVNDLRIRIEGRKTLEFHDNYGEDGRVKEERPWSVKDIDGKKFKKVSDVFEEVKSNMQLEFSKSKEYKADLDLMEERTIKYLQGIGLINDKSDVESLVARNLASQFEGNIRDEITKLEQSKMYLDKSIQDLIEGRDKIKYVLGKIDDMEKKIDELQGKNDQIVNMCARNLPRSEVTRLLLEKMDNQSKIQDIQQMIDQCKRKNGLDIERIDQLKNQVDLNQAEYDQRLIEFKNNIGLNKDTISNLMVSIYNKYQDEILAEGK